MSLPPHLQGLNPPQLRAVQHTDGPLLILAGAGSGKTRVLTRRVAHLLHQGVQPWNVLAVTFTNKAAAEMKLRTAALVGSQAEDLWVSTFHSTCVRILRRDIEALGYTRSFVIYDADEQLRLQTAILKDLGVEREALPPKGLRGIIDRAKTRLQGPEQLAASREELHPRAVEAFRRYEARLRELNALDFSDLINKTVQLFQEHPEVLRRWQQRFQYLMVDEYQDTNHGQYLLVKMLGDQSALGRRNVAVVGDDDQSIYSFRGADIRNILDFEQDFPEAEVVRLEQNYRSTGRILRAAMAVVKQNTQRKDKELWTEAEQGEPLQVLVGIDEDEEASKVGDEVRRLVNTGTPPGEIAIIYRTNARSRSFETALRERRLPYTVVGARKFYERKEVKDLVSWLRLLVNPADDLAFERAINSPRRGVGPKTIETLAEAARQEGRTLLEAASRHDGRGRGGKALVAFARQVEAFGAQIPVLSPGALVLHIAEESGYLPELRAEATTEAEDRIRNVHELARDVSAEVRIEDPMERLQAFLDRATLTGQDDELPDGGGQVTLLTAHLAKGLEYPVVFVAGLYEGSFPLVRGHRLEDDLEEERRLMYVAITRAQQRLYLTRPLRRRSWGEQGGFMPASISPFLKEIPPDLIKAGFMRPGAERRERPSAVPGDHKQKLERFLAMHGRGSEAAAPRAPEASPVARTTRTPTGPDDFRVGGRVLHERWGEGTIRRKRAIPGGPVQLVVEFRGRLQKAINPALEPLEIVDS